MVDHLGIATHPAARNEVHVNAQHAGCTDIFADNAVLAMECNLKGEVTFEKLILNITDPAKFNTKLDIDFEVSGGRFGLTGSGLLAEGMIKIEVTPSARPSRLEVMMPDGSDGVRPIGGEDGSEEYIDMVGQTLTDLELRMFDESGRKIDIPKGTMILPSWFTSKAKPCTSVKLPKLLLPTQPGEQEYNVRVKLPGKGRSANVLEDYRFKVTVIPGFPHEWHMELANNGDDDGSVRCGVEKELQRIVKVFAVDEHGNRAQMEAESDAIQPVLTVLTDGVSMTASVPKSAEVKEKKLRPISRRLSAAAEDENGYKLVPMFHLGQKAKLEGQVCTCSLGVADADSRLQSCKATVELVAGEPVQIVLKSNIIGDGEEDIYGRHTRKIYTAQVPAMHQLEDLQARVVDSGNNVVDTDTPLALSTSGDVKLSDRKKVRAKKGFAKFPSSTLTAGKSVKEYTLEVSGMNLPAAQIVCTVLLGNGVTGMAVESFTENVAVCGKPLDVRLKVMLTTEDGQLFKPSEDSFECEIKRKVETTSRPSQNGKTATPDVVVIEGGMMVKDGRWVLDDVGSEPTSFVPEQSGAYMIKCSYNETRVGMANNAKIKPISQPMIVKAGPAAKLEFKGRVGTINATNGPQENGRKLQKVKVNAVDAFGNVSTFPEGCSVRVSLVGLDGTDQTKWPALEGHHPIIKAPPSRDVGQVQFDLALKEGIGELEGEYELRFEVVSDSDQPGAEFPTVERLVTKVNFSPDGKRSAELQEKTGRLQDLEAEQQDLLDKKDRAENDAHEMKSSMKEKRGTIKNILKSLRDKGVGWAKQDLEESDKLHGYDAKVLTSTLCEAILSHVHEYIEEVTKQQSRPAKLESRQSDAAIRQLGFPVVEAGFADDEETAYMLAWMAGSSMACIVAPDKVKQRKLFNTYKCECLDENQLAKFRFRDPRDKRFRERSAEEKQTPGLPLELPLLHQKASWPDDKPQPEFAVNMVQLKPEQEYLRDYLFHFLFGSKLIMNTLEEAQDYREACVKAKRSCSEIYTREGFVSLSGGRLSHNNNQRPKERYPNVFGGTRLPFPSVSYDLLGLGLIGVRVCLCVTALGAKGRMSTELNHLKAQALQLYEDHPELENLEKRQQATDSDYGARKDELDSEIASLQGTLRAACALAACLPAWLTILTPAHPLAAAEIKELKSQGRKRGAGGGSDRGPAQKQRV